MSADTARAEGESPAELGYRWPAEWEEHAATWLAWPHNRNTWPDKFDPVPEQFAMLVKTIARFEPVHVLAGGPDVMADAMRLIGGVSNVVLEDIATNDAWTRDHGPMFLVHPADARQALVDWKYNAWGGKYPPFDLDDAVPQRIAQKYDCRRFAADIVLEGGAVDGNGAGTIMTTTTCLLNPNRNGEVSRSQMEQYLARYCGARKVLWLEGGDMAGDDTDGHIDQLARFVAPSTVVCALTEDNTDNNFRALQLNFRQLQSMTDQDGRPLTVVPLWMPQPMYFQQQRLPASYCNFYIINGAVLVPQFGDAADARAVQTLARLFPGREVIGLPALDLVWGLGAFHCLTQQQGRA